MKKDKIVVCILIVLILLFLIMILKQLTVKKVDNIIVEEDTEVTNKIDKKELESVKSYSAFYTVQLCVERYITYLTSEDVESLLAVLDEGYIQKNDINRNNVLKKLEYDYGEVSFYANEMYYEEVNEDINRYYVAGYLEKIDENDYEDNESAEIDRIVGKVYFEVNLDYENMIFTIKPMEDGGIFYEKND